MIFYIPVDALLKPPKNLMQSFVPAALLYIQNQSGSWHRKRLRPGRKPDPVKNSIYAVIPATPPGAGWWHLLPPSCQLLAPTAINPAYSG
jgi:hypothetical protein